ncbi:Protein DETOXIFICATION [Seminavis robusta]|uniref:Protein DETOXIFICATION n=1 Tax=Seminavis robusta TaxID=568900 RepID=A0A9N8DLH1_9STRA|nr:Protein DETOXIFICATION [Seminavis robusta]|eukprot:Sro197_g083810.1 Protein DETOXIFICATION (510) ;mRNA; r:46403-48139
MKVSPLVFVLALLAPLEIAHGSAARSASKKIQQPPNKVETKKATTISTKSKTTATTPGLWPCFDELDKRLIMISIPMIINFSITPLVGANDLFWTNRMGNVLAVAGQAAATQVFNSGFWLASFLPSVTSTLVSKENAKGNQEGVQDSVCQALFVAVLIAAVGTPLFYNYPDSTLGTVLETGAPAMEFAKIYLNVRAFSFLPALIALVGFSAFRGILDVKTPFMISVITSMINCVLDPILIFGFDMGLKGNALSTLLSEVVSAITFLYLLAKRDLIKMSKLFRFPSWSKLLPLIKGGFAMQLRLIAFNITFIAVARVTQGIDKTGVAAAAHEMALQTFQLGGVALMALSVVAQIVIPNELHSDKGGARVAKATSNRMMSWGLILGTLLGGLQILVLPWIQKATPMEEVRAAARAPAILASILQPLNGLVFIGEGVMSGCGDFMFLAVSTIVATVGCVAALQVFPQEHGVSGVWMGFAVFNVLRMIGVLMHQFYVSPIAPRNINKELQKTK